MPVMDKQPSDKWLEATKALNETLEEMKNDPEVFKKILDTGSNVYRYSFNEQVLIARQNADATACATYAQWNNPMKCAIKRGSKGIALPQNDGSLKYVFDVSQVVKARPDSILPNRWEFDKDRMTKGVFSALEKEYGSLEGLRLDDKIMNLAKNFASEMKNDITDILITNDLTPDMPITPEVIDNIEKGMASIMAYEIMSRMGIDTSIQEKKGNIDFSVFNDLNIDTMTTMASAISRETGDVLRFVGKEVTKLEMELGIDKEREVKNNDRDNLQTGRGLSSSELKTNDLAQNASLGNEMDKTNGTEQLSVNADANGERNTMGESLSEAAISGSNGREDDERADRKISGDKRAEEQQSDSLGETNAENQARDNERNNGRNHNPITIIGYERKTLTDIENPSIPSQSEQMGNILANDNEIPSNIKNALNVLFSSISDEAKAQITQVLENENASSVIANTLAVESPIIDDKSDGITIQTNQNDDISLSWESLTDVVKDNDIIEPVPDKTITREEGIALSNNLSSELADSLNDKRNIPFNDFSYNGISAESGKIALSNVSIRSGVMPDSTTEEAVKSDLEARFRFTEYDNDNNILNSHTLNVKGYDDIKDFVDYISTKDKEMEISPDFVPMVTVEWSEAAGLPDGLRMPLHQADELFKEKDLYAVEQYGTEGGYDKTKFELLFNDNGELKTYEGRQDFGDGDGSLIDHITQELDYIAEKYPDEYKATRDMLVPYLNLHKNLSELEEQVNTYSGDNTAKVNEVTDYIKAARTALNNNGDIPEMPDISFLAKEEVTDLSQSDIESFDKKLDDTLGVERQAYPDTEFKGTITVDGVDISYEDGVSADFYVHTYGNEHNNSDRKDSTIHLEGQQVFDFVEKQDSLPIATDVPEENLITQKNIEVSIEDDNRLALENLQVGDMFSMMDREGYQNIYEVTEMMGDFSVQLDVVSGNPTLSGQSFYGNWKEQLLAQAEKADSPITILGKEDIIKQEVAKDNLADILRTGSNNETSKGNIFEYAIRHLDDVDSVAEFMRNEYQTTNKGFSFNAPDNSETVDVACTFNEQGLSMGIGHESLDNAFVTYSWGEIAKNTIDLIKEGEYLTKDESAFSREDLSKGIAERIVLTLKDNEVYPDDLGFNHRMDERGNHYSDGVPTVTERINEMLNDSEGIKNVKSILENTLSDLKDGKIEERFSFESRIENLIDNINEFALPVADVPEQSAKEMIEESFITDNEIDNRLRRAPLSGGEDRIYNAFTNDDLSLKDKAELLKNEYGMGGHGANGGSSVSYVAKGFSISKGVTPHSSNYSDTALKINLTWNDAAKRVQKLVDEDKYFIRPKVNDSPKFKIYQIKDGEEYRDARFENFARLESNNIKLNIDDYDLKYDSDYPDNLRNEENEIVLESIFEKFNIDRPDDFKGHSLSVSDVVVLTDEYGEDKAFFCDSFGFREFPEFLLEKELEQEQEIVESITNEEPTLQWNVVHDADGENGEPTTWSAEINSDEHGQFAWIENQEQGYVVTVGEGVELGSFSTLSEAQDFVQDELVNETSVDRSVTKAEDLTVGDMVMLPPQKLTNSDGKTMEFPAEKATVTDVSSEWISFKTEKGDTTSSTPESLNQEGFEFLGHDESLDKAELSSDEQYLADMDLSELAQKFAKSALSYDELESLGFAFNEWDGEQHPMFNENFLYGHNLNGNELINLAYRFKDGFEDGTDEDFRFDRDLALGIMGESGRFNADGINSPELTYEFNNGNFVITTNELSDFSREVPMSMVANSVLRMAKDEYERNNEKAQEHIPDKTEEVSHNETQKSVTEHKSHTNFVIKDDSLGEGTPKEKFDMNLEAIKALKSIDEPDKTATDEDREKMSKYVGWGGLSDVFDERKTDGWVASAREELKQLLTEDEYKNARSSTQDAFYTSPTIIDCIYEKLEDMGFKGGSVLEPSCGVGNFIGRMPEEIRDNVKVSGVELDSITGQIAKELYPQSDIQIKGFQDTKFSNNTFDVAIGNVPFGNKSVYDKEYKNQNLMIHDYFFNKALDKVKPGGVVAFITSKGSLDKANGKAREMLAEKANFLGAVRLPNTAFKKNAGTEVTSDIIFLQKKEFPSKNLEEQSFIKTGRTDNGIEMNQYFIEHPEMICGKMELVTGRFGMESSCIPDESKPLKEQIQEALKNINGKIEPTIENVDIEDTIEISTVINAEEARGYSYILDENDRVFYKTDGDQAYLQEDLSKKAEERIVGMVKLRDVTYDLLDLQTKPETTDAQIKEKQSELKSVYDDFVKKNGRINESANERAFREDDSYYLIASLELTDESGKFKGLSNIFTERTATPITVIESVANAQDALAASISQKGNVDFEYMESISDISVDSLKEELVGIEVFKNPANGRYETNDEYLSGNVRKKLEIAKDAVENGNDEFRVNVENLEKVIPIDIPPQDISVRLGASWIPKDVIKDFMQDVLNVPNYLLHSYNEERSKPRINVEYEEFNSTWHIDKGRYSNIEIETTYGTPDRSGFEILESCLNLREITVSRKDPETGSYYKDVEATKEAQAKQSLLRDKFSDWVFKDPDRRDKLTQIYNEKYNCIRPREFDGSRLKFDGMNPSITLEEHQKNAIARQVYGGNTLLAHCVGAGKTFTMIGAAMEERRIGITKKPLFVVPKPLVGQWAKEFATLYPNAKVLASKDNDFTPANRKKTISKIATNDYDAVIISQEQFKSIPLNPEFESKLIQNEIDERREFLEANKDNKSRNYSVKAVEKEIDKLEKRLEEKRDFNKDNVITFEQLGVDRLFVDESHAYKNLGVSSKIQAAGIASGDGSQKALDMLFKCKQIGEMTDNKGVTFATGTPISNSMTEIYTNMKFLQEDLLKDLGCSHFDQWASSFGNTKTEAEFDVTGQGFHLKTRFNEFYNLPELMSAFKESADIVTADMLNLGVPDSELHIVETERSDIQTDIIEAIGKRCERIHNSSVDPREDNMLNVTNDGRKVALDARLINPDLPENPNGKIATCVENAFKIYKDNNDSKATQIIFSDLGTPNKEGRFDVYHELKNKLIEKGVPEKEIAIIHDFDNSKKKAELQEKMREGNIRFLIGSTSKCGTGLNVQNKLKAVHHIDVPWRPSDIEQREGRIIRRGNENKNVDIFRYVTKGTFDVYSWQLIEAKARMTTQVMTSKTPLRAIEETDVSVLDAAAAKAICADNPLALEKVTVEKEFNDLKIKRSSYSQAMFSLQDKVRKELPDAIDRTKAIIVDQRQDARTVSANNFEKKEDFKLILKGEVITDKKEAGEKLTEFVKKNAVAHNGSLIGEYKGFKIQMLGNFDFNTKDYGFKLNLIGKKDHEVQLDKSPQGNITRMDNALDRIEKEILPRLENKVEDLTNQLERAKEDVNKPFPQEAEYQEKRERLEQINRELDEMANKSISGITAEIDSDEQTTEKSTDIQNDIKGTEVSHNETQEVTNPEQTEEKTTEVKEESKAEQNTVPVEDARKRNFKDFRITHDEQADTWVLRADVQKPNSNEWDKGQMLSQSKDKNELIKFCKDKGIELSEDKSLSTRLEQKQEKIKQKDAQAI